MKRYKSNNHSNKPRSESVSAISTLSSLSSSSSSMSRGSGPYTPMSNYLLSSASEYSRSSYYNGSNTTSDYDVSSNKSPVASTYHNRDHGFEPRNSYSIEEEVHVPTTSISANAVLNTRSNPHSKQLYPIFPPSEEMKIKTNEQLLATEASFKVLYAGDAVYKPDRSLLNKTKRAHFVLTNNHLLLYKSASKARNEINIFEYHNNEAAQKAASKKIDKDRIFLKLSSIYAVQTVVTVVCTFRIEYVHPQSGQALAHTLTVDSEKECKQWVQALCLAVRIHLPRLESISGTERYSVLDRLSKQSDSFVNSDLVKIYKVVFKEKRYKLTGGDQPKEVFLPVMMAIGKFSFYFLPISVLDNEYLKAVERDRFGLLSIMSIKYENVDDTVVIDVKQVGKSNRQLVFASAYCEEIVQYLYRSIESIVPGSAAALYSEKVPPHIRYSQILPFNIPYDPEDEMTSHDDKEVQRFNTTLRAYSASFNMNKSRFNYTITGPLKTKVFTLLAPNEIGGTPSHYEKYELLALLRSIQANNVFVEVSFANCALDVMESWKSDQLQGWTYDKRHPLQSDNILSNELYTILTNLKLLRKLDLTNCSIGRKSDNFPMRRTSAIATIGIVMKSGNTRLSRIKVGKNLVSETDLRKLMQGIKEHKKSTKELHLNECGLEKDMIELVLKTLYEKNPDQIISLDLSTDVKNSMAIDPTMVENLMPSFKRLEYLRMRSHNLLSNNYNFMLESSRLRELDLGGSRMDNDMVTRLCQWIGTPSFNCIESLHLGNCKLNGNHVYDILISISQTGNRDMHLNLENNPIMKEVVHLPKLHSAILQGEGPRSISFAQVEWDDSTLCEFIDCLRDNQTISHLDLSDIGMRDTHEISEDTIRMMTSFFERNTCITELELNYRHRKTGFVPLSASQPKPLIAQALVRSLHGLRLNSTLLHLDISKLNLEDAGAMALARVLKANKVLRSINLDENNITIEGYRSLTKVIEENATQLINVPTPQKDVRAQLRYLIYRIEELIISENEAQFFLIHTTVSDKKKLKKHELEVIAQERRSCELALKNLESVVHSLMVAVRKNMREYEEQNYRNVEFQMQAQVAAQELATAQVRLQGRTSNAMSGTNLSAVGVVARSRNYSSSAASFTSSTNSSVHGSSSRRGSNSGHPFHVYNPTNHRSSTMSSDYSNSVMSSPTPYHTSFNFHTNDPRMYTNTSNNIHEETIISSKPHSNDNDNGMQPPITPSIEYPEPYYSAPINYPENSNSHLSGNFDVDDPGFISDFGYVDDFEHGIDPLYFNVPPKSNSSDQDSLWNEEQIVQKLNRGLYLPPDEKD